MSITLLNTSQIKNYSSPTGLWTPTGWVLASGFTVSGTVSATSGNIVDLSVNNLNISGTIRSPYLSGLLGTTVSGSGIIEFVAIPDVSGRNAHYYHTLYQNNRATPIQSFSSQDSQVGWFYYYSNAWSAFPFGGLSSTQQQSSIVRHIFQPTGFSAGTTYFNDLALISSGNVTGSFVNSIQFQSSNVGFTVVHPLSSSSSTSSTTYSVPSGGAVSGANIIFSGAGQIVTKVIGGNQIVVSGGGVNQISVPSGVFKQGNFIVSGGGYTTVTATPTTSGTLIGISGGVDSVGIALGAQRQGNISLSGEGGVGLREITTSNGAVFVISGGAGGGGGIGNVTGIGTTLSAPLFTGGFVITGSGGISATFTNVAQNISGIIISSNGIALIQDFNDFYMEYWNQIGY